MTQHKYFLQYAMVLAMLLWAAGWSALKILTEHVSFEVLTFWRFAIMFVAFIPILFYFKKPILIPQKSFKYIFGGALLNILFMVLAFFGVLYGSAGAGGVIITTISPIMTFGLVIWFYKKRLVRNQFLGLFLGALGGIVMLNLTGGGLSQLLEGGNVYYLLSALTWAFVTIMSQKSHLHIHPIHYSFAIAGVALCIVFIATWNVDLTVVFDQSFSFWIALLYLGIFGQTVATTIFFIASGKLGSGAASSYMFLVPVFAPLMSFFLLGEALEIHIMMGGFLTLFAVYLINKK